MWYSTERLAEMDRAFKARTGNMPPEMREKEWAAELERGWQEIEDGVLSFKAGHNILDGGRFDTLSLGTWMTIVEAADLTYIPVAMAGFADLIPVLQEQKPIKLDLPKDASRYRGVVRLDCCGSNHLKANMAVGGQRDTSPIVGAYEEAGEWYFAVDERSLNGLMTYVGQIEGEGDSRCPIWWRPWVEALKVSVPLPAFMGKRAGSNDWPLEWRVIVQRGEVAGISAYYIQAPVTMTPEVRDHLDAIKGQMETLLTFMRNRKIQPWHPLYIGAVGDDDLSFSCDFISTPAGPAFLEAGPRVPVNAENVPVREWGAHPCCFVDRPIQGIALDRGDRSVFAGMEG